MLNNEQDFSFKQLLSLISVSLCVGILIPLGVYSYKQKSLNTIYSCLPLAPSPTLSPGQKAKYTFYIQATNNQSSQELVLSPSDTGKVFTAGIGTLIIIEHFGISNSHISHLSPQDIFKNFGSPETIHLPNNALGAFRVYRAGCGTITVIET